MMRPILLAATLLLAVVPGAARAQPPESLRDVSFGEFTRNVFISNLPLRFRIPDGYVAVRHEGQATRTHWMSPADSAALAGNPEHAMPDGFYSVALSLSVGYDVDADRFIVDCTDRFIGGGCDETTMEADLEAKGFTAVSLERHRLNGYPVLFMEATRERDGRRFLVVYMASLVDTGVVYAYYEHPESMRELDQARWAAFKAAIIASPPPAAP